MVENGGRLLGRRFRDISRLLLKAFGKARKEQTTRHTHFLSTSLRRLLVADMVASMLMGKPTLHRGLKKIEALRKSQGALRDMQEVGKKAATLTDLGRFQSGFIQYLSRRETVIGKAIAKSIASFDLGWLEKIAVGRDWRKCCECKLVSQPEELPGTLLAKVLSYRQAAIEGEDLEALHKLRVKYKKYRYAVEFLHPDHIYRSESCFCRLKETQRVLGEAHDWVVVIESWRQFASTGGVAHEAPVPDIMNVRLKETSFMAREMLKAELPWLARLEGLALT